MERVIVGALMIAGLVGMLALLTQIDGCNMWSGGRSPSSSNTYDRFYDR